jgi:MFS family permease
MLAFGPLWGRLVAARGPKPVMILGFAVMGAGALGLAFFHTTILALTLFTIPALVGNVAVLIAMSNIIVLSVSPKELGIQTGMNQTFRNLGSAVGPVLAATITASFTAQAVVATVHGIPIYGPVPGISGFVLLFVITAGVALIGLVLSFGLRNYRFHADGSRLEAPSARPEGAAPASVGEPAPAVSASRADSG